LNTYEVMFLFDPAVGSDWSKVEAEVNRLMERSGAQLIMWGKWDERRLAYPIKRHKRAVYVLAYFRADPEKIADLERDARLSESILRSLVLRADHVSEEQMRESIGRSQLRTAPATDGGSEKKPAHVESGGDTQEDQSAGAAEEAAAESPEQAEADEAPAEKVGEDEA